MKCCGLQTVAKEVVADFAVHRNERLKTQGFGLVFPSGTNFHNNAMSAQVRSLPDINADVEAEMIIDASTESITYQDLSDRYSWGLEDSADDLGITMTETVDFTTIYLSTNTTFEDAPKAANIANPVTLYWDLLLTTDLTVFASGKFTIKPGVTR